MATQEEIVVCHLGRLAYEPARALQEQIQERLIAAKRAEPPETVPHVLLLLEHPPVYTLGKSGDAENDVTFHGPGQLVGYPLFDLDRFFTDLGRYLRTLEELIIRTCAEFDVTGTRVDGRTGVWVGPDARGLERKICAMGVRCSRWVTMHGFAFNVTTNLDYFDHIVPCAIDDRGVTSLAEETDASVAVEAVRPPIVAHVADLFDAQVTEYRGTAARRFLRSLTDAEGVD
ncbi:MAG: lipoyl(octanoyl) transferase [Bacteroidetes bacterium QH_9_64_21]|nr:MAG: lipoyl(octanoyl) transferase [Bacteroidetes bacterium QH_9_64_21]